LNEEKERGAVGEPEEESYGWEYHKVPLLIAVIIAAVFYILIWIFVK